MYVPWSASPAPGRWAAPVSSNNVGRQENGTGPGVWSRLVSDDGLNFDWQVSTTITRSRRLIVKQLTALLDLLTLSMSTLSTWAGTVTCVFALSLVTTTPASAGITCCWVGINCCCGDKSCNFGGGNARIFLGRAGDKATIEFEAYLAEADRRGANQTREDYKAIRRTYKRLLRTPGVRRNPAVRLKAYEPRCSCPCDGR